MCWRANARKRKREREWRMGAVWHDGGGDGRKNDGHKYRSYLCFMTVRPRYRQEESARIRGKAPTIDSQILTDVLAQWIPASRSEPLSLSFSLSLSVVPLRPLFLTLSLSLPVEGGSRMNKLALQREFAALASADPNLRYLLYGTEEKRAHVSTVTNALHMTFRNCRVNCARRYFS